MKNLISIIAICLMIASSTPADTRQNGTRTDAIAMVERVVHHFSQWGLEQTIIAISDTENPDFHDRDLYAFIISMNGVTLGHGTTPNFIGKNLTRIEDINGVRIVYEFIKVATEPGKGWVTYHWLNPVSKKVEQKQSYIFRLDEKTFVGVGTYLN